MPGVSTDRSTPLAATATGSGLVFVLLLVSVWTDGLVPRVDASLNAWTAAWRTDALAAFGFVIATPGDTPVVLALLAFASIACAALGRAWHGVFLGAAVLPGYAAVYVLKETVARTRPLLDYEGSMAFPSGHAAKTAILYALLLIVLADAYAKRTRWRDAPDVDVSPRTLLLVGGAVSLTTGVGRILSGVHWPSDVIAGWSFGAMWVSGALLVFHGTVGATPPPPPRLVVYGTRYRPEPAAPTREATGGKGHEGPRASRAPEETLTWTRTCARST